MERSSRYTGANSALKGELPQEVPSLGEGVKRVASLGGYLGRKGDGFPGPKTMWIGLQRMADFAIAWRAFAPDSDSPHGQTFVSNDEGGAW